MNSSQEKVVEVLNRIFDFKYNSLANYIVSAQPYLRRGQESLLTELQAIASADRSFVDQLSQAIESFGGAPVVKPYHQMVSNLNYLSLDYLLGVIIREWEGQLESLRKDREELRQQGQVLPIVEAVIQAAENDLITVRNGRALS